MLSEEACFVVGLNHTQIEAPAGCEEAARIYGQRSSRQKAAKIRACVERVMQEGDA